MTSPRSTQQQRIVLPAGAPLDKALGGAGIETGRPVIVLIGGAAKLAETGADVSATVREGVVATAQSMGATIVDGGTDSGVMALAGQAYAATGASFPLVGVAPIGRVAAAGVDGAKGTTPVEPNHTHVVLVPGDEWGAEAPFLVNAARSIGKGSNIVAVLIDGGPLALQEAMACAAEGWPLVALAGSGRTADLLAAYERGADDGVLAPTPRAAVHVVELADGPAALASTLAELLRGAKPPRHRRVPTTTSRARIEYPALYVAASEASKRGQRNFKWLSATDLGFTLLALVLGLSGAVYAVVANLTGEPKELVDAALVVVAAVFFLAALLTKSLIRTSTFDNDWFNGRAVAETVKSLSWRYMARVPPFGGADADDQLTDELAAVLRESPNLHHAVERLPLRPQQISRSMREIHERSLVARREFYVERRLLEQAHWYRERGARHRRAATRWFWVGIVLQVSAVGIALLVLGAVTSHQTAVEGPLLRLMSLLASLAIAVTAWTQLNKDDELAKQYGVALQELLLLASATERAQTEEALAAAVRDGEEAIGRENRVWVARRADRVEENPEFGKSE